MTNAAMTTLREGRAMFELNDDVKQWKRPFLGWIIAWH
jgi:hypothetical protein